jgi:hypothetical protein
MQPLSALRNYFELFWLHEIGTPMAGSTIAEPIESPPVAFSAENPRGLRRNDPPRLTNFDYYDKQRHEVRDEKSRECSPKTHWPRSMPEHWRGTLRDEIRWQCRLI